MAKTSKLNVFSIPSQTATLFWLIAAVLLGAMAIGVMEQGIIPMWPIGIALLLLPIREFLARPERDINLLGLKFAGESFPILQEYIRVKSEQVGLKRTPRVLIDENKRDEIYVMGSFSRWFIVMGDEKAQKLENLLSDSFNNNLVEVQILHELHHFKTGDYWQLGYLAELFRASFKLMLWFMLFFGALGFTLALAKEDFFSFLQSDIAAKFPADIRPVIERYLPTILPPSGEIESLRVKAQGFDWALVVQFIVNIALPYVALAGILWFFYRPLLWRVREYYADAGVAQEQGGASSFWDFIFEFTQKSLQDASTPSESAGSSFLGALKNFWVGNFWPAASQRLTAVEMPESIFYNWKQIAWILGPLSLSLTVFLATPITLTVVGKNPMIFSILLVAVPLAYFLLPRVVMGESAWKNAVNVLLVIFGIHTAWLALTLIGMWGLYFFNPALLMDILQSAIYSIARYAGPVQVEMNLFDFLVESTISNSLQVPFVFVFQLGSVLGLLSLFKRILSWHSRIKTSQDFKKVVLGLTFAVSFALAAWIAPVGMAVISADFSALSGGAGFWAVLGFLALTSALVWFYLQDRAHYQKCPSCHAKSGLGQQCDSCGAALNPWLWVEYNDE